MAEFGSKTETNKWKVSNTGGKERESNFFVFVVVSVGNASRLVLCKKLKLKKSSPWHFRYRTLDSSCQMRREGLTLL